MQLGMWWLLWWGVDRCQCTDEERLLQGCGECLWLWMCEAGSGWLLLELVGNRFLTVAAASVSVRGRPAGWSSIHGSRESGSCSCDCSCAGPGLAVPVQPGQDVLDADRVGCSWCKLGEG